MCPDPNYPDILCERRGRWTAAAPAVSSMEAMRTGPPRGPGVPMTRVGQYVGPGRGPADLSPLWNNAGGACRILPCPRKP